MGLFTWIGKGCQWLFKLVALPLSKLGSPQVRPVLRWSLHVACLLIAVVCLTYLDVVLELNKVVRAPLPALRVLWLPILFVMIYALAWLAWWTWKVATTATDPSRYPDLDTAWQEALHALEQAKIDLASTPLYLVLGRAATGEAEFFQATGQEWEVPLTPRRAEAPLRLCATRDAVFVSLAKVSTSGLYAAKLAETSGGKHTADEQLAMCSDSAGTYLIESDSGGGIATAVATKPVAQRGLELIEQSLALLQTEEASEPVVECGLDAYGVADTELELAQDRLAHVCHLISETRTPYCPINGVVTLIPWPATATQLTANRAAVLLDRDLQTMQQELELAAPRVAIVTDLQDAPGGQELVRRIPDDQRHRRFGVRFPQLADCDANRWPLLAQQGLQWLCQQLLPGLIYRVLACSDQSLANDEQTWAGNVRLYRFLHAVQQREARLTRIVERGLLSANQNVCLGGLYFAATGNDENTNQAFLPGVLPQILEMQNFVAWSPAALRADARCRRWTRIGYVLLAMVVVGLAAAAIWGAQ